MWVTRLDFDWTLMALVAMSVMFSHEQETTLGMSTV